MTSVSRRTGAAPPCPSVSWRCAAARVGALALVLTLAACGPGGPDTGPQAAEPAQVGVVTLQTERHVVTTELPGRTNAFLSAEIRPQVGGIVQKRLFTEGATVKAGQPLYQIDAATYEAQLASAQAQLSKARANLGMAQTNAQRNAELVRIDAISRQQYDDGQAALQLAQSDVAVAQAAVKTAQINLAYTQIRSPIAGRTATSTVTPGALVTANQAQALTTVTQTDPLYVDIVQPSTEVLRLKEALAQGRFVREGQDDARVTIVLDDGTRYAHRARLQFNGVQVDPGTATVTLRATVPNPGGLLMPGMYVRAVLEAGVNEAALLAPQQAVTRDPAGNASVLLVTPDDRIEQRRITTGAAVGNRWEVLSGLQAGDRILVDGSQRVRAGDAVTPVPWQPPAPPQPAAAPVSTATPERPAA
ncbi:efflux RND transporter periplasmic adaptor subunit [Comamonas faecalis]|uniref:efflux RND transporter periplasmic adaptor subunit n=1 Tax=Comamonas faecalis TaxID=1387849 RepID=UPI000C9EF615